MSNIGMGDNSAKQLFDFIERIESLEAEKAEAADNIKAEYAQAKAAGFDVKAMRQIVKEHRKGDIQATAEHRAIVETYRRALGGFADTELGQWAMTFAQAMGEAADAPRDKGGHNVTSLKSEAIRRAKAKSNEPLN